MTYKLTFSVYLGHTSCLLNRDSFSSMLFVPCQGRQHRVKPTRCSVLTTLPYLSHVYHGRVVTLPPYLGRTPERLSRNLQRVSRAFQGRARETIRWLVSR